MDTSTTCIPLPRALSTHCTLPDDSPLDRDTLVAGLRARGVASAPGAVCAHREKAYSAFARGPLPVTEALEAWTFLLPLYPQMEEADVAHVIDSLRAVVSA